MMDAMTGSLRRLWTLTAARTLEYLRDRSSLIRNLLVPIVLIAGLGYSFSGPQHPLFKVAVIGSGALDPALPPLLATPLVQFYDEPDRTVAVHKVELQQVDMAIEFTDGRRPGRYWVNQLSQRGALLERLMLHDGAGAGLGRQPVAGAQTRYVDWVLPGVLGLNVVMSALFGIGTVIVSYRRSGYLKRLRATPLRPAEFLAAQLLSRLFVVLIINSVVFAVCKWLLRFRMEGSYLLLVAIVALGTLAVASVALVITSRISSGELSDGILNLVFLGMMMVSGVFFSTDGAPPGLRAVAALSPLSHLLQGMRGIMLDGDGFATVAPQLAELAGITVIALVLASLLFKWRRA